MGQPYIINPDFTLGGLSYVQTDGSLGLTSGAVTFPAQSSAAWGDLGLYYATAVDRGAGIVLKCAINLTTLGELAIGWDDTTALPTTALGGEQQFSNDASNNLLANAFDTGDNLATSTDYQFAIVLTADGAYYILKTGTGQWRVMFWDQLTSVSSSLYAFLSNYDAVGEVSQFAIRQMCGAWAAPTGIATNYITSFVTGAEYAHEPDLVLAFQVNTAAVSGNFRINFRQQDLTNRWTVFVTYGGLSVSLIEAVDPGSGVTETIRATVGTLVEDGDIVVVTAEDNVYTLSVYDASAGTWGRATYTDPSSLFTNATTARNVNLGTTTLDYLALQPRIVSGALGNILESV